MSTVQTIIERGYAKSAAARPETMTATAQLVARVATAVREVFQVLSREAPYIIGAQTSIDFDGSGWPRPDNCLRALELRVESGTQADPPLALGTRVQVVPFDDRDVWPGVPCVMELGQRFLPSGQSIDPSGGSLLLLFARAPQMPTAIEDVIDPLLPSFFDDFLENDVAFYLARQDKRAEDEQAFTVLKQEVLVQIVEWARAQTYGIVQRHPLVSPPLTSAAAGRPQPAKGA